MKKKILSFILSAAMAITGIGVGAGEPVTVYAEGETGESESVPAEGDPENPAEPVEFTGINIDEDGYLFEDKNMSEDATLTLHRLMECII